MSDYDDYYGQYSDGFASGPEEEEEFGAVDTLTNRRFRTDRKVNVAWSDLDRLKDVRFNFAVFLEGLHRCSQDLCFGNVDMQTHFGRFLQHFSIMLECGWLPELYIVRVQSLLESTKPLLSRLEGNQRSKYKARMKRIMTDLDSLKEDSFAELVLVVERQEKEIKALQARVKDLEAQLAQPDAAFPCLADTHSSPAVTQIKSVKCHSCKLLLPTSSFSGSQLAKRKGRKCASCLHTALQASSSCSTATTIDLSLRDPPRVLAAVPDTCALSPLSDLHATSFSGVGPSVPTGEHEELPVSLVPAVRVAHVQELETQRDSSSNSFLSSLSSDLVDTHTPSLQNSFLRAGLVEKKLNKKKGSRKKRSRERVMLLDSAPYASPT